MKYEDILRSARRWELKAWYEKVVDTDYADADIHWDKVKELSKDITVIGNWHRTCRDDMNSVVALEFINVIFPGLDFTFDSPDFDNKFFEYYNLACLAAGCPEEQIDKNEFAKE